MSLSLDIDAGKNYKNKSQKIRIMTEDWVLNNVFCPRCGAEKLSDFENNRPVADFYCSHCKSEYELKSKEGRLSGKIVDGAYDTMIKRIVSDNNPDFMCLSYAKEDYRINSLIVIPKHFFVPDIIEKRKPLSPNAKRAGWVGCNILINDIPDQGKIHIIKDSEKLNKKDVVKKLSTSKMLEVKDISARGWLFDILNCVNDIGECEFTLENMYSYEKILGIKHPNNKNIKAKIRQQLQLLRDCGVIEFTGRGKYKKII